MIWSDDTLSPAKARPAVIESAAQIVIAFNPENLTKLVIVVILVVTRPPLWRLDAPNIGQVHRHECDAGHMGKRACSDLLSGDRLPVMPSRWRGAEWPSAIGGLRHWAGPRRHLSTGFEPPKSPA